MKKLIMAGLFLMVCQANAKFTPASGSVRLNGLYNIKVANAPTGIQGEVQLGTTGEGERVYLSPIKLTQ